MKITLLALAAKWGALGANELAGPEGSDEAMAESPFVRYPSAREPNPKLDRTRNSRREVTWIRLLQANGFIGNLLMNPLLGGASWRKPAGVGVIEPI